MNYKQTSVLIIFSLAFLILLSFVFLFSVEGFYALSAQGFKLETRSNLPDGLSGFYQGNPPVMALFMYILFTLSAFLPLKEKSRSLKVISTLSFVFLFCIFVFLL